MKYSEEDIITEILRIAEHLNQDHLKITEFIPNSDIPFCQILKNFNGSWITATTATGLRPSKNKYTKDDAINELRRVAKLLNKTKLSSKEYDEHSKISVNITRHLFGGNWNQAVKEAGLIPHKNKFSQEELISEIQRIAKKLNQNHLTMPDFENNTIKIFPSSYKLTWNESIKLAGLEPSYGKREIPDDIIFRRMLEIFNKDLKYLNSVEYRHKNPPNYYFTMRNRYHGWKNVIANFFEWLKKQDDIVIDFTVEDLICYIIKNNSNNSKT